MPVTFNINTGSNTPIYKQITEQVRLAVTAGRLAVGDQLAQRPGAGGGSGGQSQHRRPRLRRPDARGLARIPRGPGRLHHPQAEGFSREEGWRRLEPLLNALIGEAMILDFTRGELREAFEEKLSKMETTERRRPKMNEESVIQTRG
jgi:hypothetical protein